MRCRIKPQHIDQGIEILDRDTAVDLVYSDAEYFGDRSGYWAVPNVKQSLRNYGEANREMAAYL